MDHQNTIGLAILSWNKPHVLEKTLKSYKDFGFLDMFDEKIILLQENLPSSRMVAEKFDLTIYYTEKNIGIGKGNNLLIDKLTTDFFIICQEDFLLTKENFKNQINNSIQLINNKTIDCCRLRNVINPGEPHYAYYRYLEPKGDLQYTHASECIYNDFVVNPHQIYPEIYNNFNIDKNMWILKSKYANYTENPCLYKREWYIKNIYPHNQIDDRGAELNVQKMWEKRDFNIGICEGIFTHNDM